MNTTERVTNGGPSSWQSNPGIWHTRRGQAFL
jgi:hypothetical protein